MPEAPNPNNGGDPILPEAFSVGDFETSTQQLLREDFEHLTEVNTQTLSEFDPEGLMTVEEQIKLWSAYPEAQNAEVDLAKQYHKKMLQGLGLEFTPMGDDDPTLLFQYTYEDGTTTQIKRILRTDGTSVALKTTIDADGLLSDMLLQNNQHATEEAASRQAWIDKVKIISRIIENLHVNEDEAGDFREPLKEMSTADLQTMLTAASNLEGGTTGDKEFDDQMANSQEAFSKQVSGSEKAIRKARKKYARAAMPSMRVLDRILQHRAAKRALKYKALLEGNLRMLEYNDDHVKMELDLEQGRRHAELNNQLHKRKLFSRIGATAMIGLGDLMATASFTAAGEFHYAHLDTEKGLGIGLTLSAVFSTIQAFRVRNRLRLATPFDSENTAKASEPLDEQLGAEIVHGSDNVYNTNNANTI